jgi:hypothetical protein
LADIPAMRTVPETRLGKIAFYESHIGPWASAGGAIGVSIGSVTALAAKAAEARAAYDAHLAALSAARAATDAYHEKVRALHADPGAGADMIAAIRNHALTTDDPGVSTLAQIPPPKTPGVLPPPGVPPAFAVDLLANGAVRLKWKCPNPRGAEGTIYEVLRSTDGGPFAFVATTGTRSFTDDHIPPGAAAVTYQITAARSTARGQPARFTVRFGTAGQAGGAEIRVAA